MFRRPRSAGRAVYGALSAFDATIVDVNLLTIPAFSTRDTIHVVVESPRGSQLKLKYDPRCEAMGISRPLPVGLTFPVDWGFGAPRRALGRLLTARRERADGDVVSVRIPK